MFYNAENLVLSTRTQVYPEQKMVVLIHVATDSIVGRMVEGEPESYHKQISDERIKSTIAVKMRRKHRVYQSIIRECENTFEVHDIPVIAESVEVDYTVENTKLHQVSHVEAEVLDAEGAVIATVLYSGGKWQEELKDITSEQAWKLISDHVFNR